MAFVLPTPASWKELQVTERFVPTVHPIEPVWRCVPDGAFAGEIVAV